MKHLKRFVASALLVMVSTIMCAQKIEVSGTVVDETGEAIIGASIIEKGTSNATISDFDGNFKLSTSSGAKIVVSYIGFITQELNVKPTMKIVIKEDAQSLQEVVVTGYTTQRKADLTGSVAVVQTKDLKTSSDSDPMRALQGKVAGMTISTDGSPSG